MQGNAQRVANRARVLQILGGGTVTGFVGILPIFMNTPCTSWPCSTSNRAATEESTPPDRPTTIRLFTIGRSSGNWDEGCEWKI